MKTYLYGSSVGKSIGLCAWSQGFEVQPEYVFSPYQEVCRDLPIASRMANFAPGVIC